MRYVLLALLSLNAGYVDAAGFLALHGLFTTHVTGNFVTLGASFALGTSGALGKLLALPTFCAAIFAARLASVASDRRGWPTLRLLFAVQIALLAVAAAVAARFGPFPDADAWPALAVGLTAVAAMAIQNALHRMRLSSLPPSTVMTLTTTQVMIDLADLARGVAPEARPAVGARLRPMALSVLAFAAGCGAAAFGFRFYGELCFLAPPAIALAALVVDLARRPETA